MNLYGHYKESKKEGLFIALLSMLPDFFVVLRRIVPIKKVKKFCLKWHNTQYSIRKMYKISRKLGRAWELHREQDLKSHNFKYTEGGEEICKE